MYNDKVLIRKHEFIPPITDSVIPLDFCQNNETVINFTINDITSKSEAFFLNKIDPLYITESIRTECLQALDEYWDEGYTP